MQTPKANKAFFRFARWHMLPLEAISLTGGFWAHWQDINRQVTLQHGYQMLEEAGSLDNLRLAAGLIDGQFRGMVFQDSDTYKWLEAAAYELQTNPNPPLRQQADETIDLIANAQQEDGYLNSYVQTTGSERWADLDFGHELYCAGHLFEAAAAFHRATGTTKLLEVATHFADLIGATFGPGKRQGTSGHPEIELALVELYRATGRSTYLDLAKYFIDQRGKGVMRGFRWMEAEYHQDRVPVRQASIVEGHAVRAMYLNVGVTDLFLETGEEALLAALDRQWHDMIGGKVFLTGGLGSRYEGEAFGDPYELPPDLCYCETCAAIGSVMWNWRMLLVTGEARFADLLEQTLYNGVLSGLALDGKHFFYINPLLSRGGYARQKWYECACCPPNLMRLLASLARYLVTADDTGLQVHLYNTATVNAERPTPVSVAIQTDYPWQGLVRISIEKANGSDWQLRLRIPGWCSKSAASINGQLVASPLIEAGYLVLERAWQPGDVVELALDMPANLIEPHPRIDAVRDSVAIQRGPVVYCLEAMDRPQMDLMEIRLDQAAPLQTNWRDDLVPQGLMAIQASGCVVNDEEWSGQLYRRLTNRDDVSRRTVLLTAVPYYAWANRGANAMRVWIPCV